jgi:hypothetical protein
MTIEMKPCPKCGCPNLELDSSVAAEASWIRCRDDGCENYYQQRCDEETCVERWNCLDRSKIP